MVEAAHRWLILVHQLPPHPTNLRVRVWRRLQQVGAVVLRNSLYVLPATDESREDFHWVREEIQASGGQVSVLAAAAIDGHTDAELEQAFRRQRTTDYEALAIDVRKAGERFARRRQPMTRAVRERTITALRERFGAIQARDHFKAAGRMLVEQAFRDLESVGLPRSTFPSRQLRPRDFLGRTWVTRPRPGIDRMASAWLIRRFVAPNARFAFAETAAAHPRHILFDMPDVEFGHHGSHCTFETLMTRFRLTDRGVLALSRIVHDLDLKEARFGMPECAAVERLVDGLRATHKADAALLEAGIVIMEALYQSFLAEGRSRRSRSR